MNVIIFMGLQASGKSTFCRERFGESHLRFNDLPEWQRCGAGVYWETYTKAGANPVTGSPTVATRRRLKQDLKLPMKDQYDAFIRG